MILLVVFIVIFAASRGARLPPNFQKCNRKQLDLEWCVFAAAKHGLTQLGPLYKQLNIPNFEPLEVSELSTHPRRNLINMDEKLTDCKFHGLSNIQLEKFKFDLVERVIEAAVVFPEITTLCHYKINGSIFYLPFNGEGPSSLKFTNFNASFHVTYDEKVRHGKTYVKIVKSEVDGKPERIHFKLDNLYNGEEGAGVFINRLLNENWSDFFDDIKGDYLELANSLLVKLLDGFLSKLSIEEAFDD